MEEFSVLYGSPSGSAFAALAPPVTDKATLATVPVALDPTGVRVAQQVRGYAWQSTQNHEAAMQYVHGLEIACEYELGAQVQLYVRELTDLITKDAAQQ